MMVALDLGRCARSLLAVSPAAVFFGRDAKELV